MRSQGLFQSCALLSTFALACLTPTAMLPASAQSSALKPKALMQAFVSPTAATDTPFFVADGVSGGQGTVTEYTAAGQSIRSITFPANTGSYAQDGTEYLRGIAATDTGKIVGFNGTFSPELTTYDPRAASFSSQNAPGWEIANDGSSGTVGVYQGYSYVINEGPDPGGEDSAIIRFNPDGTNQQFATSTDSNRTYINLTVGLDGKLYALYLDFTSNQASAWALDVYDPVNLQKLRTVNLQLPYIEDSQSVDLRNLAVDAQGSIYTIDLYNYIYHFDTNGSLLQSVSTGQGGYTDDIKIDPNSGRILIGIDSTDKEVLQTDASLSSFQTIVQFASDQSFGCFLSFTTPKVAAALDGSAHILWSKTDGTMSLWTVSPEFTFQHREYGPYPGWNAVALAQGVDGVTHVLWSHSADGQAAVWNLAQDGTFTSENYGPYSGWNATGISLGPDNKVHLLWNQSETAFSLWTFNNDVFDTFTAPIYTTFQGLPAQAIATGADNFTGILWNGYNSEGLVSLWRVSPADGSYLHHEYGPYNGWTAINLSIGSDNQGHLLWDKTDGTVSLWNANLSTGAFSFQNYGPYSGWAATQVATGLDGISLLLWNHPADGQISLWHLDTTGAFTDANFGPYSGWTAIAVSPGP